MIPPSDQDFLKAFEQCTLTAEDWTHESHIRMAFLILREMPYGLALTRVRAGINRLNAVIGVKKRGYHETITVAYLRIIAHRLNQGKRPSWEEFKERHPDLLTPALIARHYSLEALDKAEAKAQFIEPDREPLPSAPSRGERRSIP